MAHSQSELQVITYAKNLCSYVMTITQKSPKQFRSSSFASNASVSQPDYWDPMPLSKLFDGTMISAFVKTVKPNPTIYRLFTEKFHLKEEECVFIDDFPLNVAGAVACGWHGIVFHDGDTEEMERKLKELGVRY